MASGRGVSERTTTIEAHGEPAWPAALGGASSGSKTEDGAIEVALLWGDRLLDQKQFPRGHWPTLGHLPHDSIHVFDPQIGGGFPLLCEVDGERRLRVPGGVQVTSSASAC
ncbi:MAG: hypothetical protein IRZ16_00475 [Myxococcaceae bacterium]|nr:hypothetical protein [Myxococcaceae bacterium]